MRSRSELDEDQRVITLAAELAPNSRLGDPQPMSQPPPENLGPLPSLELHFYPITDGPTPAGKRARFAAWLDATRDKSGVYVIRLNDDLPGRIRYVGSSRKRNWRGHGYLRTVILRHVHGWNGPTAGVTYHRDDIEIAVILCRTGEIAGWAERELTRRLGPVDNAYNQTAFRDIEPTADEEAAEEIPF